MISVNLQATVECEELGCTEQEPAKVVLLASGGLGFQIRSQLWQIIANPKNPFAPFLARCPKHAVKVQVGPSGPRLVSAADGH